MPVLNRVLLGSIVVVGACSDGPSSPGAGAATVSARDLQRIAVADAATPAIRVMSTQDGSLVQSFTLSGGPASLVYVSGSGRFVSVQQRTRNIVEMFDGGVWTAGELAYRRNPSKLSFALNDSLPTHENVNGHWKSVFFDGSGVARWMDERQTIAGAPAVAFEVATGGPHHSGSSTVEAGGVPYFLYAPRNPTGGLPSAVVAVNSARQEVARRDDCTSMHGNGTVRGAALFGCVDGAVLFRPSGSTMTATKLTPSGELAGLGIRAVWGRGNLPWLVGRLSAPPGQPTQRHLATVTVASGAIERLPMPTGVVEHSISVEPHSGLVAVLATNGTFYVFNGHMRTLVHTLPNLVPALPVSAPITHQVATVQGLAAVASPYTAEVVLVDLQTGSVMRRLSVSGQPSRLAILGPDAAGTFRLTQ